MASRYLIITLLMTAMALPCAALQWSIESVYDSGVALGDCTLLYTGSAAPEAVYSASGSVYLATRSEVGWPADTVASCGNFGGLSSAAFDGSGRVGVAFVDNGGTQDYAKFATNASGAWAVETVASLGWLTDYMAVGYDSSNNAWMAYCDGQFNPSIKVTKRISANNWQLPTTISTIGDSTGPAMVIGADNTVWVSFTDTTTGALKVAHYPVGGPWTTETVDGSVVSPASGYTSITTGPNSRPVVAYFGNAVGGMISLKYAIRVNGVWQLEQVVQLPYAWETHCSVAVAGDGTPWIAYLDTATSTLACAWKTGGTWNHETVDYGNLTGYRPSIRLDSGGNPSIAYVDQTNAGIDFASAMVPRSLGDAKKLPDGAVVRCEGLIASTRSSTNSTDFSDRHYVQSSNRLMGMMLYYGQSPDHVERGTNVTVTGVMGSVNGERAILSPVIIPFQSGLEPNPFGMPNSALGGGGYSYLAGPPATGQKGISGAVGVNNLGLLVRVWGKVVETDTSVPAQWFKIDDGTGVRLKCQLPTAVSPPTGFVTLKGISSCEDDGLGNLTRVLRLRTAADIGP